MAAMSSAQIVSASAIHNIAMATGLGIHPPVGPAYPPYTPQVSDKVMHANRPYRNVFQTRLQFNLHIYFWMIINDNL